MTTLLSRRKQAAQRDPDAAARPVRPGPALGFRSILCPVDFSADSGRALACADALARRWGSELSVLYAVDPMLASAAAIALHDPSLIERTDEELRDFVRDTLKTDAAGASAISSVTLVGRAADEVLRTADRVHADLIVMGTHGMTGPGKLLVGSTTQSVLHRTNVPILAVPTGEQGAWTMPADWPGKRLVLALDFSPRASEVAANAARIADSLEATLLVAHVVPEVHVPAWMQEALSAHDRIRLGKATAALEAIVATLARTGVVVESRVVSGNVADEIAALVATERAGLVITALDKGPGWLGPRRGTISYHVLSHAIAPVLALPR